MANYTSVHTGAVVDASVTKVSASGVTQADLTKLNAVTSTAAELNILDGVTATYTEINVLDGITANTSELNILDGVTANATELNYLDGADSSINTLVLPDNTTISIFGASLIDDADAASARTTLNVDVAGTDNSTDVTLNTTSYDYLSLSGQQITLGQIDISDDTNLVAGADITLTDDTLSVDDSFLRNDGDDTTSGVITAGGFIGDVRGATKFLARADVALAKGDAVYISGVVSTTPTVGLADANDSSKMPSFGLAATSAAINDNVEIITFGTITGVDTSAFTAGDILYISTAGTTGNTLTATPPSGESSLIQNVGIVQRVNPSVGSIKVGGAGRTNATPNLNDGNIFIGNGSNQVTTASLNTKIETYLDGGTSSPNFASVSIGGTAVTATATELNILDGADADLNTLSLPASTTISTFGASLVDDADASAARTTLGVDPAGTDNSTDVTLAGSLDYLTIAGQVITRNAIDLAADVSGVLPVANGGTGASTASGARTNLNVDVAGTDNSTDVTLVTTSHDYLSIAGQAITLGTIDISDDTNLVGGTGITLTGDTLSTTDSEIVHDNLSGFVANEHIDHSTVSITAGTGLSGGGDLTATRTLSTNDSEIVHDNLSGFVANEHIDHSGVTITAGSGLTGGGDITTTRTLNVGAGTHITVNADDVAVNTSTLFSAPAFTGTATGVNLTLSGDLTVNGTTTTLNTTNVAVTDNLIELNQGTTSNANDSGILIERGTTGDNAIIMWDESADKFTVGTTTATADSTGDIVVSTGTLVASTFEGNLTGNVTGNADTATALATGRTISLTGDVTGTSGSFDGTGNVSIAATIAANSVALGTDTTGNYMSDLTEGTGIDITHTPAEGSNATIALDLTEVGFGGGANRLITDDGDGTVTSEANLTFDGSTLTINNPTAGVAALNFQDTSDLAIFVPAAQTTNYYQPLIGVGENSTTFTAAISSYDAGSGAAQGLAFHTGDTNAITEAMRIDSSQNVGIGTTSPSYKLDVNDASAGIIAQFQYGSDTDGRIQIYADANAGSIGNDSGLAGETIYFQDDVGMRFYTHGSETMRLTTAGNVGIGTASPRLPLHIASPDADDDPASGSATGAFFVTNSAGSYGLHMGVSSDGSGWIQSQSVTSANEYNLNLNPIGGNVGIGTSSPGALLDVGGRIKLTSSGVLQWGASANYGNLTWDGDSAIVQGQSGRDLDLRSGSSRNILFKIGSSEKMRISASGNVGIGTASPGYKLEIEGSTNTDLLALDGAGTGFRLLGKSGDGSISNSMVYRLYLDYGLGTATNGFIDFYRGGDGASGYLTFGTSGTEKMRIDSSGNVGIGTTSPTQKLQVAATATNSIKNALHLSNNLTDTTNAVGNGVAVTMGKEDGSYSTKIATVYEGNNPSYLQPALAFYTMYNTSASGSETEKMRISASGNVGIGNNSPSIPLQIGFTTTNGEAIKLDGNASYGASIYYSRGGSYNWNAGVGGASSSSSNIPASFWGIEDVSQGNAVRLAIAHTTGNVGIGTNSPGAKLEVVDDNGIHLTAATGGRTLIIKPSPSGAVHEFESDNTAAGYQFSNNSGVLMKIQSNGNVGIGNNSPSEKLHVTGNIRTSGNVYIDNPGSDYSPGLVFLGGSNNPSLGYETGAISYFDNAGTGLMRYTINRSSGAYDFYIGGSNYATINTSGLAVTGAITATGDVTAYYSSDKRLKDNIKPIDNAIDKVQQLGGYEFDWNDKQDLYTGHDIGVIAQEVEEVLPELVATRDDGYKAVKYEKMVALLIEAIKEQQQQINELKEKLNG